MLTAATRHFIFFDSIGGLVKKKLIDVDLIDGVLALNIVVTWRLLEDIIYGDRESFNTPSLWEPFEYLYNELSKREEFADSTPFYMKSCSGRLYCGNPITSKKNATFFN